MKIIGMMFTIIICVFSVSICQGFKDLKRENVCVHEVVQQDGRGENSDEYGYNNDSLHEYEQYVCDQAVAPKLSTTMVVGARVAGYILIKFIMLKEAIRRYYIVFKGVINKLVQCVLS